MKHGVPFLNFLKIMFQFIFLSIQKRYFSLTVTDKEFRWLPWSYLWRSTTRVSMNMRSNLPFWNLFKWSLFLCPDKAIVFFPAEGSNHLVTVSEENQLFTWMWQHSWWFTNACCMFRFKSVYLRPSKVKLVSNKENLWICKKWFHCDLYFRASVKRSTRKSKSFTQTFPMDPPISIEWRTYPQYIVLKRLL